MKNDNLCVNSLRILALEQMNNAGSGHPGIALGAAPIMYSLYAKILNVSLKNEKHILRDRFVLSAGHGSALLYATLNAFGFNISTSDLKSFRTVNSKCPGHPEHESDNAIDATTGPLGQGVANAVGMAIAQKHMASVFNKDDVDLFDNYTYCLMGDGCLMEGVANEALSLAGSLCLNKLIVIYDFNKITLDGGIDNVFMQNTKLVFKGYGFNVIEVKDGGNVKKITNAINKAKKSLKPSIVIVHTKIGVDSSLENSHKAHGTLLSDDEVKELKTYYGFISRPFEVERGVRSLFSQESKRFDKVHQDFEKKLKYYKKSYKEDFLKLETYLKNDFSDIDKLFANLTNKKTSTRVAGGEILNLISQNYSNIIGGSADVQSSTRASAGKLVFNKNELGRTIMFGVREFAMSAICNGIALYGGRTPYASTFMVFADYLKAGARLSALSNLKVLYILTHDSILVGQDGPTHQPVEQLAMFRSQPNTYVFRPCDFIETAASYSLALNLQAPSIMSLSRQDLSPVNSNYEMVKKGAYILKEEENELKGIIISTGSEIEIALKVAKELEDNGVGIRVVSMPCMEIFDNQADNYKEQVLNKKVLTFAIEYSSDLSFYKYISKGEVFGVYCYGKSGKPEDVRKNLNINYRVIFNKIKSYYNDIIKN